MRLLSLLALFAALPAALAAPLPAPAQEAAAGASAAGEAAAPSYPAISVIAAAPRLMSDRVLATGLVAPVEEVLVQPLIEGQPIEALLADVGDSVRAGQVLAVLSKTTLELQKSQSIASLASARATIAQAEAQMVEAEASAAEAERVAERARKLREQGAASQAAADTANAERHRGDRPRHRGAPVARRGARPGHADRGTAGLCGSATDPDRGEGPYAGRITARNAVIGAIATAAGQPMFVMEKDGALELRADVAEGDVLRIGRAWWRNCGPRAWSAPLAGSVRWSNRRSTGPPALAACALPLRTAHAVAPACMSMPRSSCPARGGGRPGQRHRRGRRRGRGDAGDRRPGRAGAGQTGIRDGGWVEIVAGLMAGDSVVSKAGAFVRPGDRITPVADTATN
jgi:HlyD family secretion protein